MKLPNKEQLFLFSQVFLFSHKLPCIFGHYPRKLFITAHKQSLRQDNAFTPVCHSVHMAGGVCLTPHCMQTTCEQTWGLAYPPGCRPPWMQTPLMHTSSRCRPSLVNSPGCRTPGCRPPQMQTPRCRPPVVRPGGVGQTLLDADPVDRPPRCRPPRQNPPTPQADPAGYITKRVVRILLECILVLAHGFGCSVVIDLQTNIFRINSYL